MKAAVYHGPRDIRVEEIPIPEIREKDVLVKVKYCGVCGTDLHIYNGEGGFVEVVPPLIPGHEFSGTVVKTGAYVTGIRVGDSVAVDPNDTCGECYFCKNAMEHFCRKIIGYGTTKNGGFAEYAAVPEKQVFRCADGLDPMAVAMTEPLSCCLHGIDLCHIRLGDEVLVIGGGPIGLIMLQLAKRAGATRVILSEPVAEKRALAEKLGADRTIDPLHEDVMQILSATCKNVDVVIECVGNRHTLMDAVNWAGFGATVMMFGLTGPEVELPVKPDIVFKKELKITSSYINPHTFERALRILEAGTIDVTGIIANVVALEDAATAFTDSDMHRQGKTMIRIS